ncbi:DNA polymerase III, delta subunit [Ammonifex degensii KC4]|uniref:DNA polymerase III subunit delta n=1 Tax=Ammonifex degensii (strain DSM 10501 / KC4) TaxID=429009 RepID=C9R8P3_AMMDK|nr:DNA polymerase III subunit delta [Ammonifex degensii]ACX52672.1 DNA polymerase III, delta subunit [Ammonifex degensii KC4]
MQYFLELLEELKRREIRPLYLFWGPERYLQKEAVRWFRTLLVGEDNPFDFARLDGEETSGEQVAAAASTSPVLAQWRLVVVDNAPYFAAGKKQADRALLDYLRHPSPTTCLIFCTTAPIDRQKPACRLLAEKGKIVEFTYLSPSDLLRWLQKRAREAGKQITPEAARLLLSVGQDLSLLRQEWEKVLNYAGEQKEITPSSVEEVVTPPPEELLFRVTDDLSQRQYLRALGRLRMLAEKEPPGVVLALFLRQLRLLLLAQEILAEGGGEEKLAQEGKIPLWVAKKILGHARRFPREQAQELYLQLVELDAAFKSGRGDFWLGLERSLWQAWLLAGAG